MSLWPAAEPHRDQPAAEGQGSQTGAGQVGSGGEIPHPQTGAWAGGRVRAQELGILSDGSPGPHGGAEGQRLCRQVREKLRLKTET